MKKNFEVIVALKISHLIEIEMQFIITRLLIKLGVNTIRLNKGINTEEKNDFYILKFYCISREYYTFNEVMNKLKEIEVDFKKVYGNELSLAFKVKDKESKDEK